jgi:hypothetical protein
MANASARNIAQAPTLRSGSPSNLRVRCSRRTAESRYLPRLRLAPAGRSPAATKARRRTAPGSPLLSVGVPPVLPSSTSPLLPVILTPYPPVVLRDQPARLCSGTLRALRCTPHHILPGFSVLHPRAQISETERRITALVCGFTPRSYPRCYKRKCKRNIVEPTSRKEIRFLRSRHLQNGEADSQERRRSDYEAV